MQFVLPGDKSCPVFMKQNFKLDNSNIVESILIYNVLSIFAPLIHLIHFCSFNMNDENLTSNDLFGSGSDIGGTNLNGGFQNFSIQPDHFPEHHY